jgi:hypothetical protein
MRKIAAVLAASICLATVPAFAGDTLPDPLAGLQAGKKSFEAACSKCHTLDRVLGKRLDRSGWEAILGTMTSRGASFESTERALIVDYLTVKSTFENKCSTCHETEGALASKRTREQWKATVERMAKNPKAALTAEDIRLITAYLTLGVGSEQ